MIISTNFSTMPKAPVRLLSIILAGLALVSLLFFGWLILAANELSSKSVDLQSLQTKLDKRVAETKSTPQTAMPNSAEIKAFQAKVALLNQLDEGTGLPASLVLAKLEKLLPGSAWLINFRYQRELGEINLTTESRQTAPLALFLHRLEKSDDFKQVLLVRQLQNGEGINKRIQYSIKFTGRPQ